MGQSLDWDIEDRQRITSGVIKSNDLDDMNKPYAWVIIPTIVHEDADDKEHMLAN